MSKIMPQLVDDVREMRWQLIRQNQNFCYALTAAIKDGGETAEGVTATVRTRNQGPNRNEPRTNSLP
jgi:hypothetical protein